MNYKHPIVIQIYPSKPVFDDIGNDVTDWIDLMKCRADINGVGGKEYYSAAAQQAQNNMTFTVRYCKALKDIAPQSTRIIYNNNVYDIKHIDDFMQNHTTLKIKAVRNIGKKH